MNFIRQFLIWFLSALCVSAGAKLAHYLVRVLSSYSAPEASLPGSPSHVLCPACGRSLRRIRTSLVCLQCGYKEDASSAPAGSK
jgi:predicted amidophosphoribosyltransferase